MQTTTVIKLKHSRDLLAYVPHRLGYMPRGSLVLIGMSRQPSRTVLGLVVRCDLPRGWMDDPDAPTARQMVENLFADTSVNAIVPVLYLDPPEGAETPAGAEAPDDAESPTGAAPVAYGADGPEPETAAAIRGAVLGLGFELVDELWVAGGRWRSYACNDPACCPPGGRPITEIESSAAGAELVLAGSSPAASIDELTALPSMAPETAAAVRKALAPAAARRERETGRDGLVPWRRRQLTLWRRAFDSEPATIDPDTIAGLIVALSDSWFRDGVLLDIFGFASHAVAVVAPEPPPDTMEVMSRVVGASRTEPAPERLARAEGLLKVLAGAATGPGQAAPLAILGWIEWCRGRSSTAGNYLDSACEADGRHRLAALLKGFVDGGLLPYWVTKAR